MIAKIFAVLGLYSIFNKPNFAQINKMNLSLSSVRTILGGVDVPTPKVIPEAIELYVRLPLLAEWYRDTIGINRTIQVAAVVGPPAVAAYDGKLYNYTAAGATDMMIAFIPDISGIWSEFINLIFNRVDYVKEGTYSEGIQADIEIKSTMRIDGRVPDIPKGGYYVSVRSALDEVSKLENDLKFTVL